MKLQEKPSSNLFLERFKRGLWNWYKLTLEELTENYKYCGGDGDNGSGDERHHNYWVTLFGNEKCPYKETECFCGQQIRENCFVVDKTKTNFVHMGNCCIKRFMPENKSGRTCEICEEPHKNRKDNLCHDCRETHKRCGTCKEYFEFDNKKHEYCDECYEKKREKEREERRREFEERQKENEKRQREFNEIQKENEKRQREIVAERQKEREERQREILKKIMNTKKGFMNANQTATRIKEIKICSECNNNYETYNTIEEQYLCNECKQCKQIQIDEENKKIREENIKKKQRIGLMCYCELITILREVGKDGPNKGKLFYCCSKSYDNKCDYFMWKNESDRRINKNVEPTINQNENNEQEENNNENDEQECKRQQKIGLICYCKLPSVSREVKKDGANKGRLFYTCSSYTDKCKYFVWKDEI
jgi:hypothetical protein